MTQSKEVFKGLLVIELASVLAGPSVGQFFAELGATVIKVENLRTRGDVTRQWRLASEDPLQEVSAYFSSANWGKKSVCLDLSSAQAKEAVLNMLDQADVVLVSFKPGDAEKFGLDYASVVNRNPKLIYAHITGYGKEVPRAGYDAVLQAEAGFMYMNGEKGGNPLKMPVAMIDIIAAHQVKEGILTALYLRQRTGQGQYVEVSLLNSALSALANQATNYLVARASPERLGSEHPNIAPYGTVFKDAEQKELVLAIGDDRQFATLCQVLGLPGLAEKAEFKTNRQRVLHNPELKKQLAKAIAQQNRAPLLQQLIEKNVPAGAVFSVPEALAQPLAASQLLSGQGGQKLGVKQVAFIGEGISPTGDLLGPPALGAHTFQVLQELAGFSLQQLQEMAAAGQVFQSETRKEN